VSLLVVLLEVSRFAALGIAISLVLLPGGLVSTVYSRSSDFPPPLAVLATNSIIYSAVAYTAIVVFWRDLTFARMRNLMLWLVAPTAILVGLACTPSLDPLFPRGLVEVAKDETELQAAFPVGTTLNEARSALRSRGIPYQETKEQSKTVVLERDRTSITASEGDVVIAARLQTAASQFPCGYEIEVVLLFGQDDKLSQQYIHRLRICP
jgi:hypothetical protein